jgi:predicted RNA-binding protein with PIN domain
VDAPQGLDPLEPDAAPVVPEVAGRHRRAAVRWIVDAMNVIGCRPDGWWRDRRAAMSRLVASLDRWALAEHRVVTVVFEQPLRPPLSSAIVTVASAPAAHADSADDEIVRLVAADPRPDAVVVVTSDRRLAERVRALGAAVHPAESFRQTIDASPLAE